MSGKWTKMERRALSGGIERSLWGRLALSVAFACMAACGASALEVTVDAGVDRTLTDEEANAIIASGEDVVKRGEGRFIIGRSLAGYKGSIRVEGGYLRCLAANALGDADRGAVVVSDGATLEFGADAEDLRFGKRAISVCGTGVNGEGALRHVGTVKDQWRAVFENVTLTGDTRFGGVAYQNSNGNWVFRRWDIRGGQGKLDMKGHNLEIACGFGMLGVTVENPGNITVTNMGTAAFLYLEGQNVIMGGSSENAITVRTGATLSSQRFAPALAWGVVLDGGTLSEQMAASGGTPETAAARIDGPVTITENGCRIIGGANKCWSFGGPVDVRGNVASNSDGMRLHVLMSSSDDASARLAAWEALCSHMENQYLQILLSPLDGDAAEPLAVDADWNGGWRSLSVGGTGAIALTGNQDDVKYYQREGYVKMTGADRKHSFTDVLVTGDSTLDWASAGQVEFGTNRLDVGAQYPAVAKLRITDTLVTTNWTGRSTNEASKLDGVICVGPARKATVESAEIPAWGGGRGVLEIGEGASVTGLLQVGVVTGPNSTKRTCHGSVIQRGGDLTVFSTGGTTAYPRYVYNYIGNGGSGYMENQGGSLTILGQFMPGGGSYGRGVWYVRGGKVLSKNSAITFGMHSGKAACAKSVFYQTGGALEGWEGLTSGKTLYEGFSYGANEDVITFAGGMAKLDCGLDMAAAPNAKTILNLRTGGSLEAYWVQLVTNEAQTIVGVGENKAIDGNKAWVNLDGGILKYRHGSKKKDYAAYKAESFFFGDPERLTLTAFAGGAKFDTSGLNVNLDHPINAPAGRGLKSLAFPEGSAYADGTWVGAPMVEISGDGEGASAVAEFDSVNNRVTGFTVTSPGFGYTTMNALLTRGGYTNDVPLAVTLTDDKQASGGLVKLGDGTLSLNAANTYGGATRVEGGTLKVVHENAIPAGSQIEVAGGAIDFGGFARDFGAVTATSGAVENVGGTMASLVKTGDGTFLLNAPVSVSGMVDVQGGILQLPALKPGFLWGERKYAEGEATTEYSHKVALTDGGVDLEPSHAYEPCVSGGYFQPYHYVSYSGYIWNRGTEDCTWTFAFAFDDVLNIFVDGVELKKEGSTTWGELRRMSVTLSPGAHKFLLQLWNAGGNGGATRKDVVGVAYDPQGRNSTDVGVYVPLKDSGDGRLATVNPYDGSTMPTFATLRMASGTTLDLLGGVYTLTGELRVAAAADPVAINGRFVFGDGAEVMVENMDDLDREKAPYVLATAADGFGGALPELSSANWLLRLLDDGKTLALKARRGTAIVVR